MFVASFEFSELFLLLTIHLFLGFAIGWYVRGFWIRAQAHRAASRPASSSSILPTGPLADTCEALMAEIQSELTIHFDAIREFQAWLDALEPASQLRALSDSVSQIGRMRDANSTFEIAIAQATGRLLDAVVRDPRLLREELNDVARYRDDVKSYDTMLATAVEAGEEQSLEDLLRETHLLARENERLQAELDMCRQQLATQTVRAETAIEEARIDALTQLPNRRAFDEKIDELKSFVERHGQPFALAIFDVDRFKQINDSVGHAAGDAVLAMLGRIMRECRRGTDHVARFGGEEFVLLVPRCHLDQAELIAERYRQRIEAARLKFDGHDLRVTVSAGIAEFRAEDSKGAFLARADAAMYAAKREGGNRVCRSDRLARSSAVHGPGKA